MVVGSSPTRGASFASLLIELWSKQALGESAQGMFLFLQQPKNAFLATNNTRSSAFLPFELTNYEIGFQSALWRPTSPITALRSHFL